MELKDRIEQFEIIFNLLKAGKKVAALDRLSYYEDLNNPNELSWCSSKTKLTRVEYIYTNPQFNRMFAQLEDGRKVDYDLSFMNIFWNKFCEYEPPKPPKRIMTIDEINEALGYEVEIVS